MRFVSFLSALTISGWLQAQENCGYPISQHLSGFESGEQAQFVNLPVESTPLSLSITSPTEGEVVPLDRLQVYGSLTGPANTGVMVSEQLAWSNANQFSSRPIVLDPGANT